MSEEEKKAIELGIEMKYIGRTKKEFLNNITYAECLYILTPENEYGNKIIELSLLKLSEIIEKLQKENEILKDENAQAWEEWNNLERTSYETEQRLKKENAKLKSAIGIANKLESEIKKQYIAKQEVKGKIEELDIAISECVYLDDDDEEYKKTVEKDKLCLLNQKRILCELLEESENDFGKKFIEEQEKFNKKIK